MGGFVAACAMPLCACGADAPKPTHRHAPANREPEPEPAEAPADEPTRIEPWDPVDISFTGCAGG
jgi:hypothetical protein